VRGTVFDVDLTNDFIHVSDHQVTLTTPDGEIVITEGNVLELSDFSFVDITNFITSMEDATWKKLNEEFDQQYFTELKKELSLSLESKNPFLFILEWVSPKYRILYALDTSEKYEDVEKLITKLSESKKQKVYDAVLSKYQKMNFV